MNDKQRAEFGKHLRNARQHKGLTATAASKLTGISLTQISLYEHGKDIPRLDNLYKLCNAYELKASDVIRRRSRLYKFTIPYEKYEKNLKKKTPTQTEEVAVIEESVVPSFEVLDGPVNDDSTIVAMIVAIINASADERKMVKDYMELDQETRNLVDSIIKRMQAA